MRLFCSDTAFARYGDEWAGIVGDLRPVLLGHAPVPDDEIALIDVAFFSGDVWPERAANFMRVALDAPNLRWIHVFSAGVDHPVFAMFVDRGVRLTTSSGSSAVPIAHTVVMQLLALCRQVPSFARQQARHEWVRSDVTDLEGRTVGIVGLGAIGAEVARLVPHFGMRAIGLRRTPQGDEPCETWPTARLPELLALCDDLVLTAPLTPETRGMIGAPQLAAMRPGAHVVNVGRGELIDEAALADALRSGQVGGAALDVFAEEPLAAESPLWDLPNVIVTPHSAGTTVLSRERAAQMFTDNLARYVRGEPLRNEVDRL